MISKKKNKKNLLVVFTRAKVECQNIYDPNIES